MILVSFEIRRLKKSWRVHYLIIMFERKKENKKKIFKKWRVKGKVGWNGKEIDINGNRREGPREEVVVVMRCSFGV